MENKKTLYVSDMDGTLLNSRSVLSETTVRILNAVIGKGAMFTVATARTQATAVDLMRDVNTNIPFVIMAGCALWDNSTRQYTAVRTISRNDIQRLTGIFEKYGNNPFVYYKHDNKIVVHHVNELTEEEREFIEPRIKGPFKKLVTCDKLDTNQTDDEAMLIFSMGKYKDLRTIADCIDAEGISCTYNCYPDIFNGEDGFIDVYTKGTTKAQAVRKLAAEIGAERIVVFGDNLNDIPMMRIADRSVAVGNAYDEVKAVCDEVTGSNDDDSVAKWIEKDFLSHLS